MDTSELVILTGNYLRLSEKACKFEILTVDGEELSEGTQAIHWFPLSQIKETLKDKNVSGQDKIYVTRWIAEMKELI